MLQVDAAQRVKVFFSLVFPSLFLEEAGRLQLPQRTLELSALLRVMRSCGAQQKA